MLDQQTVGVTILNAFKNGLNKLRKIKIGYRPIGAARILSGVHFFLKKLTTFFSLRPQKTVYNY